MSKYAFGMKKMLYLGHIISAEGVCMDPDKIGAIMDWLPLKNVSELKGVLELCGFYNHFVRIFSQTATPLTNLTRKDGFEWTDSAQQFFDRFKELMRTCPVLAILDFSKPFELHCGTLGEGLSAVLMQDRHPITYESKKLRGLEKRDLRGVATLSGIYACLSEIQTVCGGQQVYRQDKS
ncbi:uncharacterized mitochondrial protein AtMg00860-like [Cryptomeria japonica]|uniref:uncharacterized mitochondrial protein AtMg00860-like n=1 Tax=Cryptomeria japonica TaxID=3369 RepID=UPI0027DA03F2|nr:uncharacterized mitochondrial protein AtMg00860-like [Cryptomeria japonica]